MRLDVMVLAAALATIALAGWFAFGGEPSAYGRGGRVLDRQCVTRAPLWRRVNWGPVVGVLCVAAPWGVLAWWFLDA